MADNLEIAGRGAWRQSVVIRGEYILRALSRHEIAQFLSRIWHARGPKQMTLFAYAVAGGGFKVRGICNRALTRIGQMPFDRAMTALASDSFRRKYRRPIFIQSARHMQRDARMTQNTFFANRACEIGVANIFITRRQVIGLPALVIGNRGLKQVSTDSDQIPGRVIS